MSDSRRRLDPRERVEAFIADFHAAWKRALPSDRDTSAVDFEKWRGRIAKLDRVHFVPGRGSGQGGGFSSDPEHAPEEQVTLVTVDRPIARVETQREAWFGTSYHEYVLRDVDGDWRIEDLLTFSAAKDEPLCEEDEREALLSLATPQAVLPPLPAGVEPNGDRLFLPGRELERWGETTRTEVRRLGNLQTSSGKLGLRDLGCDNTMHFQPLARAVPPGRYPVDVLLAFGTVVALRLVLDGEAEVSAWHPAATAAGGHVSGVDAGNLALFDCEAYLGLARRELERLYQRHVACSEDHPLCSLLALREPDDCVLVTSGNGDGAYPAYFGVDAAGRPAVLLVDFLVLAEWLEKKVTVRWSPSDGSHPLAHPDLAAVGLTVKLTPSALVVAGPNVKRVRLLDLDGSEWTSLDQLRMTLSREGRDYALPPGTLPDGPLDVEVTLHAGYRN